MSNKQCVFLKLDHESMNSKKLIRKINYLKNYLNNLIIRKNYDLSDPKIISTSKKLDKILNKYNKIR